MSKRKPKEGAVEVLPAIGRPRLFANAAAFEAKAEEYFAAREKPSLSGLAYFMGFSDRESFSKYEDYGEEFSRTVKRARLRIEEDRINRLIDKASFTPGIIFDLKNNHGWKDQQQLEHSGTVSVQFSTVYEPAPG